MKSYFQFSLFTLLLLFVNVCYSSSFRKEVYPEYIVVVDAGSSGSRANLFHIIRGTNDEANDIKQMNQIEVTPGLSSFEKNPEDAWDSIYPILKQTESLIDSRYVYQTPIYILATAGMRVLSKKSQKIIYNNIYTCYLKSDIKMYMDITQLNTIDGEEEALYGWITVNILKNTITPSFLLKGNQKTVASLDLGGESTQIAFLKPSSNNKVGHKIDIDHDIYKRSYLFYGAKESMNRYELYISMKSTYSNRTVDSPCFNVGYQGHHQLLEGVTFMGTGDFDQCISVLSYLIRGDSKCESQYCSLWSDEFIPFDGEYIGMSMYFYTLDSLHSYLPDFPFPSSTVQDIYDYGKEFCSMNYDDVLRQFSKKHKYTNDQSLIQRCFHMAWIYSILRTGYHLDDTASLFANREINNTPIDWSFGAAVYMSQFPIPSRNNTSSIIVISIILFIIVFLSCYIFKNRRRRYQRIKNASD